MDEFKTMKDSPKALFDYYMELVSTGHTLNEDQILKMEYLKKVLIKETL